MDKLQPLIRNHFWILTGLIVPMAIYGYYAANGSLVAATTAREKALDEVKQGVSSGIVPNEDYVKKLEHINTFLESSVQDSIVDLWRKQQERMVWPQAVAAKIPQEFMAEFDQQVPFIYKGLYPGLIRKLQERVQPVEPILVGTNPMLDASGRPMNLRTQATNSANQKVMLAAMVPHARFGQFGISSQEMWDAQIDIWMTEILLDAIVKMNEDKESISEAVIRRIDVIELMGGAGERVTKDSGSAGGMDGMMMEGMPMGGSGMGAATAPTEIGFSPAEEFGAAIEGGAAGGAMDMMAEGGGGMPAAPKRYINETEESPFLERGFYLSVIMLQTKVADFVVTLANSPWPVQVRRFQIGTNPYRVETPRTSDSQFNNGMMGMGGMPLGGSPYEIGGPGGRFGGGMGGMAGMGLGGMRGRESGMGMGMGGPGQGAELPNPYASNLPEFAMGALNHPDLVRVDLCGIITMYKQPKEALAAIEARKAAAAGDATATPSTSPSTDGAPGEPAGELDPAADGTSEMPVDPNADPAADEPESMPAPADGTPAESTEPADGTPTPEPEPKPEQPEPAAEAGPN